MRFPVNSISTRSAARTSECILVFVFGLAGAAITAISVNCGGAPPVFASAITGLCAVFVSFFFRLPGCASLAAFSGTFAGMGLVHVNSHKFAWVLMMSVVVAGVLLALHDLQQRHPKRTTGLCGASPPHKPRWTERGRWGGRSANHGVFRFGPGSRRADRWPSKVVVMPR